MSPACCLPSALRRPARGLDAELLGVRGRCRSSSLWEEMWAGPAMRLAGRVLLARRGFGLLLPWRLSATCSADEILQGRLIDLVAFVDVYRAPGIPARIRVRAYEANPLQCWGRR